MYFRQFVVNKILAPDVFDYGDSKSESWHRTIKNSRSIYSQQIASRTFLRNWKSRLLWPALWNKNKIYLTTVKAGKCFQNYAGKLHFFYICIKLFRTQLKMAQQTNFVKLSIMQIKILCFWLGKPILLYEIKCQTWTNAYQRGIHFWATLFKNNLKAK